MKLIIGTPDSLKQINQAGHIENSQADNDGRPCKQQTAPFALDLLSGFNRGRGCGHKKNNV